MGRVSILFPFTSYVPSNNVATANAIQVNIHDYPYIITERQTTSAKNVPGMCHGGKLRVQTTSFLMLCLCTCSWGKHKKWKTIHEY